MDKHLERICELQAEYFSLIDTYFSVEAKKLENISDPKEIYGIAHSLATSRGIMVVGSGGISQNSVIYKVEQLLKEIYTFWSRNSPKYLSELEELSDYKVFSFNSQEFASDATRLSLFFDHLAIQDPILILLETLTLAEERVQKPDMQNFTYGCVYMILSLLYYRRLFFQNDGVPIVLLVPTCPPAVKPEEVASLDSTTDKISCQLLSDICQVDLNDREHAFEYLRSKDPKEIIVDKEIWSEIAAPVFKSAGKPLSTNPYDYIFNVQKALYNDTGFVGTKDIGWFLGSLYTYLRPVVATNMYVLRWDLDAHVDANQWGMYTWLMKRENKALANLSEIKIDDAQFFTITSQHESFSWLANLTLDDVILLRQNMEDIREIFRTGRRSIKFSSISELEETIKDYSIKINQKIDAHSKEIQAAANKSKKNILSETITFFAEAGLTIAASFFPILSIFDSALSIGKSGKKLVEKYKKGGQEIETLKKRPIGILANVKNTSNTT